MTAPTFKLTKFVSLTIQRRGQGSYVKGEWVAGIPEDVIVKANVQPMKPAEVLLLPESDRQRVWLKVYSDSELRAAQEGSSGWDGDEFLWQGYRYRVMKVYNFSMGVLDHWKAIAARIPVTAGM